MAVATGVLPLTMGSDGGGSLRIPAAACGFTGFKPSSGTIPNGDKPAPLCAPLITRGPLAFTAFDTLYALDILRGATPTDIFSYDLISKAPEERMAKPFAACVMVWSANLGYAEVDTEILGLCESTIDRLRGYGLKILDKRAIFTKDPNPEWYSMWSAGLAARLEEVIGTRAFEETDVALQRLVEDGLEVTGAKFCTALDACHEFNYSLSEILAETPILITPACVGQLPLVEPGSLGLINGVQTGNWVQTEAVFNMTRNPVATVHVGFTEGGLPVGLQMCGPIGSDRWLLKMSSEVERLLGGPALWQPPEKAA